MNKLSQSTDIDLYAADGKFLRNLAPELSCVFPETAWSGDGNLIFILVALCKAGSYADTSVCLPEPTPDEAQPTPTVAPTFAPVARYGADLPLNRDGYDLRPLTSREADLFFCGRRRTVTP